MHALRNIHDALAPGGSLVDTQPVSARPPVAVDGIVLGTLDMREWVRTIGAIDAIVAETVRGGLFELQHEQRFVVTDSYDDGPECAETVSGWAGTRLSRTLAAKLARAAGPATVQQEVRLRLYLRSR